MSSLRKQFGNNLRSLRQKAGYTQERLAEEAGISVDFLSLMERGINAPSFDNLEKLAETLNIPVKDFFDFEQSSKPA